MNTRPGSPVDPLVSVVIPTRNRSHLVGDAVRSVLDQSYERLEVWVVDDASDDGTPALLAALAADDDRLHVVALEEAGGAARARNVGVDGTRGEVLAFLDDDCRWTPTKVLRQLQELDDRHGVVACRQRLQLPDDSWYMEGDSDRGRRPIESLLGFGTSTLMVRRDLFLAVGGFDEDLSRLQDWELLIRLNQQTRVAFVPEALVVGATLEGGITLTDGSLLKACDRIITRHASRLDRRDRAVLHYLLGKFLLVEGHVRSARRLMAVALRTNPKVPRYWAGWVATFLGPGPARWIRKKRRGASRRRRPEHRSIGPMDGTA